MKKMLYVSSKVCYTGTVWNVLPFADADKQEPKSVNYAGLWQNERNYGKRKA